MPFQVLLIVRYLGAPEVGVLLLVERIIELCLELPASGLADRFGRKPLVLVGHVLFALGWFLVPVATLAHGAARLGLMVVAFGLQAAGSATVEATMESWVVDNLQAEGRSSLRLRFFGRERSIASAGGIIASVGAIALVALVDLRLFWVVSGVGELLAGALLLRVPEHPVPADSDDAAPPQAMPDHGVALTERAVDEIEDDEDADDDHDVAHARREPLGTVIRAGVATIRRSPELRRYCASVLWSTLLMAEWTEVTQAALAQHRFAERGFGALALAADVLGIVGGLVAIELAERLGSRPVLVLTLLAPAVVCAPLFVEQSVGLIVAVYLVVLLVEELFDTSGDDYQHSVTPSSRRATISSLINVVGIGASAGSAALVAVLLSVLPAATAAAVLAVASIPAAIFLLPRSRSPVRSM